MDTIHSNIDLIAFIIFIFCWLGYSLFIHICKRKSDNLFGTMFEYRLKWMEESLDREDKSVDAITLGNLMRSVAFFASTSILIMAALIPLLTYGDNIQSFADKLPLISSSSVVMYELKILLLIIIFIYSFFKYTWALRQYNYASILILSPVKTKKEKAIAANRNAKILANAARHFSMGIRSYYFGIAALSWFLNPYIFIAASLLVVLVNYRREFFSRVLDIISS